MCQAANGLHGAPPYLRVCSASGYSASGCVALIQHEAVRFWHIAIFSVVTCQLTKELCG